MIPLLLLCYPLLCYRRLELTQAMCIRLPRELRDIAYDYLLIHEAPKLCRRRCSIPPQHYPKTLNDTTASCCCLTPVDRDVRHKIALRYYKAGKYPPFRL